MNDEIKKIKHRLQLLHAECNPKAREEDINYTLDYITNLLQENETRQQDINNFTYQLAKMKEENERLKKRNEEIYKGYMALVDELTEYAEENERLKKH